MRIFLAGATGVLGVRLVPRLVAAGHQVAGMTRSSDKVEQLRALGAEPVVRDAFDRDAVIDAVASFRSECVLNELTDLPDHESQLPALTSRNARIRREGNRNLLLAAHKAGIARFLAQSVAWELPPGEVADATQELERAVLEAGGVVLRYGRFYGPGTYYERGAPPPPRIHVGDAATRTVEALDVPSGVVTLVEDERPPTG
jgi:nucleoside-diphosphate-sugar epimerase